MKPMVFEKESTGWRALASARDCTTVLAIAIGFMVVGLVLIFRLGFERGPIIASMIGAVIGMLPSVLICLPVRGRVSSLSKGQFVEAITELRFHFDSEQDGTVIYTYGSSRWMRWDSNRVALRKSRDGEWDVTVPIYVFRALRKRAMQTK
jgi:hypothetical protein